MIESMTKYGADVFCDKCSYSQYFEGHFMEVIEQIKDDDWRIRKVNGEWQNICPSCCERAD